MHYKRYIVRSPLFAPRDPRLSASRDQLMSEKVLAAFSGAAPKPSVPPPTPRRAAGSR
jgi:hypothetical protein